MAVSTEVGDKCALFNGKFVFSHQDVICCKRLHQVKEIKDEIKEDNIWLNQTKRTLNCPCDMKFNYLNSLEEYREILLRNKCGKKLDPEERLLTSDVRLLIGKNWLNINLLRHFIELLNKEVDSDAKVCLLNELECWNRSNQLGEKVNSWLESGIKKVCVLVNCGKKDENVFIADNLKMGSHWNCFLLDIDSKEIIFCDSLAWNAPHDFLQRINFFTSLFHPTADKVVFAHKEMKKSHRCKDPGCLKTPYQGTNMNICGIASLISAMVLLTQEGRESSKSWLWSIKTYNSFTRAMFIHWFVRNKIDLSDLFPVKVSLKQKLFPSLS